MTSQASTPSSPNYAPAYSMIFLSLLAICVAACLFIAANATHPETPKTISTSTASLNAPAIARFQEATGHHRTDTAIPVEITFQRTQDSYAFQRALEDRGWYFYTHWGSESAALPHSDLPILEAARVAPIEALVRAGNLPKAPADAPMINAALTLELQDPVHKSPLFIAGLIAVGAWALLFMAAQVLVCSVR